MTHRPSLTAVVCAAHTHLGKQVLRLLLRSKDIGRVYALSEVDIRDEVSATSKLTLLVQPLDYLERTMATSVPREVDLGFHCLYTPRHLVSTLGSYLFHKLNGDIPIRFLQQLSKQSDVSCVTLLTHPLGNPRSTSQFLRVHGQVFREARQLVEEQGIEDCPRIVFMDIPAVTISVRNLCVHFVQDHVHNGVRPQTVSALDRVKQRALLKHDAQSGNAVSMRDVAYAMVGDGVECLAGCREGVVQVRYEACKVVRVRAEEVGVLAQRERRRYRMGRSVSRDSKAMRDKMSLFARQRGAVTEEEMEELEMEDVRLERRSGRDGGVHSVAALGEQVGRSGLTRVRGDGVLADASPTTRRASLGAVGRHGRQEDWTATTAQATWSRRRRHSAVDYREYSHVSEPEGGGLWSSIKRFTRAVFARRGAIARRGEEEEVEQGEEGEAFSFARRHSEASAWRSSQR